MRTRASTQGRPLFPRFLGMQPSPFEGFSRFDLDRKDMPENIRQCDSTGYHGTHLHALWAILAQGLQPSGPQVPGSRFFEVTSADGSTKAVAGIYLFKADRCQKCLFYAPAVLLDVLQRAWQKANAKQKPGQQERGASSGLGHQAIQPIHQDCKAIRILFTNPKP